MVRSMHRSRVLTKHHWLDPFCAMTEGMPTQKEATTGTVTTRARAGYEVSAIGNLQFVVFAFRYEPFP
jgi:hypothetical protein